MSFTDVKLSNDPIRLRKLDLLVGYLRLAGGYLVGVHRWIVRVVAYAIVLVTDAYPPFSLRA